MPTRPAWQEFLAAKTAEALATLPGPPTPSPSYAEYFDYINSPEWLAISRAQRRARRTCELCPLVGREPETFVYAHHLHYATFRSERVGIDLVTVCDSCHIRADWFRKRAG